MAPSRRVVLDLDSTEIPIYGQQEESAYNGHFESTCYHPLLLFNRDGDCLAAKLRPGNVHSAEHSDDVLLPEIERQQKQGADVVVRADAAFAKPELYEALEKRGVKYAIRIPSNDILAAGGCGLTDTVRRKTQLQAGGPVQKLPVPSGQLEDGAAGRGQGRVSFWGTVSTSGVHRDDSGDGQPGGGAILQ